MAKKIQWLTDGAIQLPTFDSIPDLDLYFVERWLNRVGESHGFLVGELSYLFCDDEKILEVNREFLQHDYYTDIITFDYCRGKLLRGDLVISLDTVATNAELVGATYDCELLRVIVHGLLHLCGINDKGPGEREIMESHEDAALAMLEVMLEENRKEVQQ